MVIVFNNKFVPIERNSAFIYGVVQHVLHISEILSGAGIEVSFLLYNRDQTLLQPKCKRCRIMDYDASIVSFNFDMRRDDLIKFFSGEFRLLSSNDCRAILYCQSLAVADYFEPSIPIVITNHSPFVSSVFAFLGEENGRMAFDWDHPKADFLLCRQSGALEKLTNRCNVVFAEISKIQIDHLNLLGINRSRIFNLPPVVNNESFIKHDLLPDELKQLATNNGERYVLFAVSRFDYFKDVDFFLEGVHGIIASGMISGVVLIGGEIEDPVFREIDSKLDCGFRQHITRLPRLPHNVLIQSVFPWIASCGVVACTSRYDLVPYTMLEAIIAGAKIVVPKNGYVGAANLIPDNWTYRRTHEDFQQAVLYEASLEEINRVKACVANKICSQNILNKIISAANSSMRLAR
ncbi:MAG: hypothetical protein HQL63_08970 [Magnetococcales bacterium]|nr:hypothetical protein [Magnetococcales bacterium]